MGEGKKGFDAFLKQLLYPKKEDSGFGTERSTAGMANLQHTAL